mmetsp:Transcript_30041/g.36648  ORF Transcript_30041/g.36648 Transcript_30041/m.36648 type:complete len:98 (-) Transcript_30041:387-680(-)|eukprot:CAMPEP_0172507006 /NCGR_PEP_ID=MMETSP1066-20121228/200392_1 /TAXON_ID=671091 /ORGANISM="Coscinodiscus wailesii, Strain CCMP2513" /LENGTH=97 /DNA_ID=CAMNT_0013284345 /DNA_START=139 /DNA_END=432 /DNA_ORIENTATION=-
MRIAIFSIITLSVLIHLGTIPSIYADLDSERELELIDKGKGPWDECLNMSAEDCAEYIEEIAPDVFTHIVYKRQSESKRIWIQVDDKDIVKVAPTRG